MVETKSNGQRDRIVYFDYLRVFATFAVIILHIAASNWYTTDVNGLQWQTFNFYDGIVRWGVPIFVMISGTLFLNKEIPLKKIYSKYISRLAISFIVWSTIYSLFIDGSINHRILSVFQGHYHMWFILMIIGIYMCIPFIKPITQNNNIIKYFLLLSFIFAFAIPEIITLTGDFGNIFLIKAVNTINENVVNMNLHIVLGYISYFILGYYLNNKKINKKQRIIIYILGLLGFAFTVGMDSLVALKTQKYCDNYYGAFTVNVLFESIAVFTWFKYSKFNNNTINKIIKRLSKCSFGAYLIHALVIEQLNIHFGLNTLLFNPIISVISIGIIAFIISFGLSSILNRIPVVKKYIV